MVIKAREVGLILESLLEGEDKEFGDAINEGFKEISNLAEKLIKSTSIFMLKEED